MKRHDYSPADIYVKPPYKPGISVETATEEVEAYLERLYEDNKRGAQPPKEVRRGK